MPQMGMNGRSNSGITLDKAMEEAFMLWLAQQQDE